MPNTFTLIASSTVGSGGSGQIDFTSIPSTYTDLILVTSLRSEGTSTTAAIMRFNDSTTGYTLRQLEGTGSAATSGTDTQNYVGMIPVSTTTANTFSNSQVYIPNYAGSTNKSSSLDSVTENNATAAYTDLWAQLWSNTAAITKISIIKNGTNNFAQYSTAYLYGVKNA